MSDKADLKTFKFEESSFRVASVSDRFTAFIIDCTLLWIVVLCTMNDAVMAGDANAIADALSAPSAFHYSVYALIQVCIICIFGRSAGKCAVYLVPINIRTGQQTSALEYLLLRTPAWLIFGNFLIFDDFLDGWPVWINCLMIVFGANSRGIHDFIAGTVIVDLPPDSKEGGSEKQQGDTPPHQPDTAGKQA
ncbi:RDD family protein [Neisseria dentiae]|uniref:RDD family protein n=1 Tax=Neisseria dentiae TaxID=194197 RepID=UPI0035A17821